MPRFRMKTEFWSRIKITLKLILHFFFSANLPHVQINGIDNQTDGKQDIVNLFFWLESWNPDQTDSFKTQLQSQWPMIEKLIQIRSYH